MASKAAMSAMDKQYQAESDLSCLIEAEKIKKDKGRFNAAMKMRKERMSAMAVLDEEKGE